MSSLYQNRLSLIRVATSIATLSIVLSVSHAADYDFTAAASVPSAYGAGANWSGGVVPGPTDAAFVNGSRIAVTDATLVNLVNSLRVGTSSAGEVRIPAGSITAGGLLLGDASGSVGLITMTGGALTSTGNAVLGEASTGDNRITLNAGILTFNGETYLGANGRGALAISGGADVLAKRINIANGADSHGELTISGGNFAATDSTFVGLRGDGTLTQSGGTSLFTRLQIGQENESISRGSVTVTGGTMTVAGPIVGGENSRLANVISVSGGTVTTSETYVGANGIATLNLSGAGTYNNAGQMHLGASGSGVGTLNVSGGNLNMTGPGGWILVGQNGQGAFTFTAGAIDTKIISVGQDPTSTGTATQSGGTLRAQRTFIVGETSTAGGTYNLSAGSIDVGTADTGDDLDGLGIFVGSYNGKGTVNITGGSLSSRTGATIGYGEGGPSDGTINISAGTLSTVTAGDEGRVRIGVYSGATGKLNVSGTANVNFAGPVLNGVARGGVGVGGTGLITVSGGTYASASMLNEAGSSYTQSGGTATLGPVTGGGSVAVSGGTANVTSIVQGSLGVSGTGTVRIATADIATNNRVETLTADGTGKLDLTNNGFVVDYTGASPIAAIRAALAAGRIVATVGDARQAVAYAEASAIGLTTYAGVDVDSTSLFLRSRLKGDANLNGAVNFDDLLVLAQKYGTTSGGVWTDGDFNYDGSVNFDDLLPLAQNYNASVVLGSDIGTADFRHDWALALSVVPEPMSLSVLAFAATGLRRRR